MNQLNRNLTDDELAAAMPVGIQLQDPMPDEGLKFDISQSTLQGAMMPELVRDEFLDEIFAVSAKEHADKVCIIEGERQLTYDEVDAVATAIARGLKRRGVGPGEVVGLWLGRGADLLIAQIAITKTGAAWLPFDADVPAERVSVCVVDAGVKILLVGSKQAAKCDEYGANGHSMGAEALRSGELIDNADEAPISARASGATAESPRLHDLHIRFDWRAEGHCHHTTEYLPLLAVSKRDLQTGQRGRSVPGCIGRVRSFHGRNLGSLSGWRIAVCRHS